ncbi:YbaB/EbfC family nucleoid-associated protein [Actinomadura nitritigenes]|uniref:YbaB/EbfC family nucleoid-associated protein n=1 Tax=Actinomadura nitritigenes TaxID=134602 RepID=UPI003D91A2DB
MFDFDPARFRPEDVDRLAAQADDALRRLSASTEEMVNLTATGEAAGGLIKATVDSSGRIKRIALNPRALRMDSETLAESLIEAIGAAQDGARDRVQEMVTELMAATGLPAKVDTEAVLERVGAIGDATRRRFEEHHDDLNEVRRAF